VVLTAKEKEYMKMDKRFSSSVFKEIVDASHAVEGLFSKTQSIIKVKKKKNEMKKSPRNDIVVRNAKIVSEFVMFDRLRKTVIANEGDKSIAQAKVRKEVLDAQSRDHNGNDLNRWDNYREAKILIIKGYRILNKRRNICVYSIIYITFKRMIKQIYSKFRHEVGQFIREIREKAQSKKIGFKWRWNHYMKSTSLRDRIHNGLRYECQLKTAVSFKHIYLRRSHECLVWVLKHRVDAL